MSMKKNVGYLDRAARTVVGIFLIYFGLIDTTLVDNQSIRYIMAVFGGVNILTAIVAFCPLYTLANFSTIPKQAS